MAGLFIGRIQRRKGGRRRTMAGRHAKWKEGWRGRWDGERDRMGEKGGKGWDKQELRDRKIMGKLRKEGGKKV
jgi:hypothetical protein